MQKLNLSSTCMMICILLSLVATQLSGQQIINRVKADLRGLGKESFVRLNPFAKPDTQIEILAREIDWLEAHIDKFGSIVAKQPDVWGESRLTKFRREFEDEMVKRLQCFEVRDNASITRSDLAFLASATSLSAAVSGDAAPAIATQNTNVVDEPTVENEADNEKATPTAPDISQTINIGRGEFDDGTSYRASINLDITEELNQQARFLNHLHQLRRINSGDDTSDAPGYALNLVRIPVSVNPGRETRRGYGARVTITAQPHTGDSLLPETFGNLVVNDIVDQLALPVLKLAESNNLPFTRAAQQFRKNFGHIKERIDEVAKIVKQQNPNDIQITEVLREIFGQDAHGNLVELRKFTGAILDALKLQREILENELASLYRMSPVNRSEINRVCEQQQLIEQSIQNVYKSVVTFYLLVIQERCNDFGDDPTCNSIRSDLLLYVNELERDDRSSFDCMRSWTNRRMGIAEQFLNTDMRQNATIPFQIPAGPQEIATAKKEATMNANLLVATLYKNYYEFGLTSVNPVSRRRRSTMPIPQVLLESVIGREELVEIALRFRESYRGQMVAWNERPGAPRIQLADVRHYLQGNLDMAYRMLTQGSNVRLVSELIEPGFTPYGLADLVNRSQLSDLEQVKHHFRNQLTTPGSINPVVNQQDDTIMQSLGWPVLIEMALLNDQLNHDVQEIAMTRDDCYCNTSKRHAYYLPIPNHPEMAPFTDAFQAATFQFQEYVRCRWPIHVFHVDPSTQDQNVQASSRMQRELAVAVAIAVASGNANIRQANQFVRQYQEEIETIGLNRTVAGFSHGSDTFGWEFRPRVQIHTNRSTLNAFGESLIGRFADANARTAAIEPGMRECTAIVLMPSFVPYCDFDVSTNWFRLDNPRSTEISTHKTVKLSRSIRQMKDCALSCSECSHLYRDGETQRLLRRVDQLERQLPLQSMRAQIPYENTLGGFELFSNGVTDLAPELVGWYGAPGVIIGGDGCFCCPRNCTVRTDSKNVCYPNREAAKENEDKNANKAPKAICNNEVADSPQGSGTTIFLVGDNFSVHETRIIAGGVSIPTDHIKMISRQVIEVNIPTCIATVILDNKEFVAIYASTPYGVTSHLHVPVIDSEMKTGGGYSIQCGEATNCGCISSQMNTAVAQPPTQQDDEKKDDEKKGANSEGSLSKILNSESTDPTQGKPDEQFVNLPPQGDDF